MGTEAVRELIAAAVADDFDLSDINAELDGIDTVSEGAQARIAELESSLADAEERYKKTAAKNYELMLAATGEPKEEPEGEGEPEQTADDMIDALFKED